MKLRVLSYNIHKCIGGVDRRYRPDRVCEVISHHDPDVCMLQEVDGGAKRSQGHEQAVLLAKELGYNHVTWFPIVRVRGGGHHGNAILSRYPLIEPSYFDMTTPPKKRRGATHARILLPDPLRPGEHHSVHLFNVHLGLAQFERKIQLRRFLGSETYEAIADDDTVVIAGDLNDVYGNLARKFLQPAGFMAGSHRPRTFPAYAPVRSLDGIYVRGALGLDELRRSALKLAKQASDHLPLIADLTPCSADDSLPTAIGRKISSEC